MAAFLLSRFCCGFSTVRSLFYNDTPLFVYSNVIKEIVVPPPLALIYVSVSPAHIFSCSTLRCLSPHLSSDLGQQHLQISCVFITALVEAGCSYWLFYIINPLVIKTNEEIKKNYHQSFFFLKPKIITSDCLFFQPTLKHLRKKVISRKRNTSRNWVNVWCFDF